LDIGPSLCRAVEVDFRQEDPQILRWAIEPVEGVDEKAAVIKVLDRLGPSARTSPLVVSVSGKGTLIRHIDMPRMTPADLRKAFAIEADKYFPFPKDSVHTDCHILDPKGKDKKMSVLVAAVKKDVVDGRLKILTECGVTPEAVTIASVAVANVFMAFPPATIGRTDLSAKAAAIVDIGESSTNLMVLVDGVPRFTRDIFMGVSDIYRHLAVATGLPPAQAREACLNPPSGREADVARNVEAVLANIVAEIRLSFDYFNTEKNLPISRICLIGDGVYVRGVESCFKENFEVPFVDWNPADMIRVAEDRDGFIKEGRRMAAALGLALGNHD
jgi:type IV pilus assembly protein PilM